MLKNAVDPVVSIIKCMLKIIAHSAAKVEKECWKLLNRHELVSILRKYFSKNEEIILANIDLYKCNLRDVTFFFFKKCYI